MGNKGHKLTGKSIDKASATHPKLAWVYNRRLYLRYSVSAPNQARDHDQFWQWWKCYSVESRLSASHGSSSSLHGYLLAEPISLIPGAHFYSQVVGGGSEGEYAFLLVWRQK